MECTSATISDVVTRLDSIQAAVLNAKLPLLDLNITLPDKMRPGKYTDTFDGSQTYCGAQHLRYL
jgi:hypothetical protein